MKDGLFPHDPRQHEMRDSVVVYLPNRKEDAVAELESLLAGVCERAAVGFSGSTEQEGTDAALYFYGPEGQPLFDALATTLRARHDTTDAVIQIGTGFGVDRSYRRFPLNSLNTEQHSLPVEVRHD